VVGISGQSSNWEPAVAYIGNEYVCGSAWYQTRFFRNPLLTSPERQALAKKAAFTFDVNPVVALIEWIVFSLQKQNQINSSV